MRTVVPPWGGFSIPRQGEECFLHLNIFSECAQRSSFSRAWLYFPTCVSKCHFQITSVPVGPMALSPLAPGPKQIPHVSFVLAPERRRSACERCRAAQAGDFFPNVREPDFVHLSCPLLLPFWDTMDKANPKNPWNDRLEACTAHQSVLVLMSAGQDDKTNENPGLSTGRVSSWAHPRRTLMSEAGHWLCGSFHNNSESGTYIPPRSQFRYVGPLRFSKLSACYSFSFIINGSTSFMFLPAIV